MIPTRKSNTNFTQFKCFTSSWRRQLIFNPRFASTRIYDPIHLFCTMSSKKEKKNLNFKIRKLKIKCEKLAESNGKQIVVIFTFLCMHFILFAMFEEKTNSNFEIQNSKFKIRKFKRQKERKRKLAWTSKKKKKKKHFGDIIFWFCLHEPRSS